ncbi:class I SAM-dependent methyltransferase [Protaetiibacter sp. SSC-01]|uniref:N5-glutamine methyltransferase family protein n=1 Tax=Protaetiibacter sp. SSC-01 TaxID=2759943 RepID=UPI0016574EF3|nr:class I SAM-dependent methyltransferase [Protaetiibacter sp. SSC-01]QNO38397.1 class I SAM-dependent methyltransferase [Protaetiibacter sp. SSC-01]
MTIPTLRADLEAARYRVDRLDELWGAAAGAALQRGNRVPASRALAASADPAALLARLFVLGESADDAELAAALPTLGIAGAVELGLVTVDGDRVHPLLDLRPYAFVDPHGAGEWWIASDLGELATGAALRVDHVLGVGGASTTLASLQFPDDVESVLDLGTGCGIQALHARRFAKHVVATDISRRALDYARLNAELNGVDGIEFRLGSLYEPVAGERFDRIVSNPPFVITPRTPGVPEYEYRDGGLEGDALVASVVAGAAEHLVPGGTAQLLGNWEYRWNADGLERAADWATDAGLDVWVIERDLLDPARYAETWIRDGGTRAGTAEFERMCAAWLDDFARREVAQVGFGYLVLRAPDGTVPFRRAERASAPLDGVAGIGAHLSTALAARDRVAALDDDALLAIELTVAPDVTEERSHWPGEPDPSVIVLRQGGGLRRELKVDAALAAVVGACDGELPLGAIVGAVAQLLDVDPDAMRPAILVELRELVADGFLLPPGA